MNNISVQVVFLCSFQFYFFALSLMHSGVVYHFANDGNCTFQMVGPTRSTPGGFRNASGSGSQQPPPPPPPNFVEYLAAQTDLLRQLVQGQQQQQQQGGHNVHQPQAAGYLDFLGTQPPLFHKIEEPLDADVWIRTIESKFTLLVV